MAILITPLRGSNPLDPAGGFTLRMLEYFEQSTTIVNSSETHQTDDIAHGSTGDIVGTDDFCELALGGTVLLSPLVNDAVDSTAEVTIADAALSTAEVTIADTPASAAEVTDVDVGLAGAAYSQAYANEQSDLINEVKSKHNTLVSNLNTAITLVNDIKAKHNTLLANFNTPIPLINGIKSDHNTLVDDLNNAITQLNDIMTQAKAAKQMSAV